MLFGEQKSWAPTSEGPGGPWAARGGQQRALRAPAPAAAVGVGRWGRSRGVVAGAAEPLGRGSPGGGREPGQRARGRRGLAGGLKPLPESGRERAVGVDRFGAPAN